MNLGERIISRTVIWVEQRRVSNYPGLLLSSSPPPPQDHSLSQTGGMSGGTGKQGEEALLLLEEHKGKVGKW